MTRTSYTTLKISSKKRKKNKSRCLYKYDEERDAGKNKVMKINETWEDLSAKSHENIESEEGKPADPFDPNRRSFWRHQRK